MTQAPPGGRSLRARLAEERGRVWVVGHRGAMGSRPENTLSSFRHALELGADWLELDVHLSRDGALVVIHDESVARTTDGQGQVQDLTLAELRQLDAGGWFGSAYVGERVPTLDEVLELARARGAMLDIEIKNAPVYYPGIEEAVVTILDAHQMAEHAIVTSFDHPSVARVKALDDRIATGVLYAARPMAGGLPLARAAHADVVLPHWSYVTAADVQEVHAAGLWIASWATSEPEILRKLVDAGVDAVATNDPDVLCDVLAGVAP